MQGALEEKVRVLVGHDHSTLEVDHESVGGQEVRAEDGLSHVGHPKVPVNLQPWNCSGVILDL